MLSKGSPKQLEPVKRGVLWSDGELKNGDITDAAAILVDGCGKGDNGKMTDGLVALGKGASGLRLANMPRFSDSCTSNLDGEVSHVCIHYSVSIEPLNTAFRSTSLA